MCRRWDARRVVEDASLKGDEMPDLEWIPGFEQEGEGLKEKRG